MAKKKATDQRSAPPRSTETSRKPLNKTQVIKDALKTQSKKGPAELSALLTEQGMQISAAYISTIKSVSEEEKSVVQAERRRLLLLHPVTNNGSPL